MREPSFTGDLELELRQLAAVWTQPRAGECVLCYVARMLDTWGCDDSLRFAERYQRLRAPRATALTRRLGDVGGFCDCEIFLNGYVAVDPLGRGCRNVLASVADRLNHAVPGPDACAVGEPIAPATVGGPCDDMSMLDRDDLENFGKAEVWEALRASRARVQREQTDELLLAAHLAGLYEAHQIMESQRVFKHDPEQMVALAGEGAPIVSEYAATELSGHLRIPLHSARQLLGDAIETCHRLPKLWGQLVEGKTEAWRVRIVAKETRSLSQPAAAWVDAQLTDRFQKRKPNNAIPQLVDEAIRRFDAALFAEREQRRADGRGVWPDPVTTPGLTRGVHMILDAPDAELLDRTVEKMAGVLKANGDTDDHQARRAKAVGVLLDPQLAFDLLNGTLPDPDQASSRAGTTSRVANIYVHCTLADLATMTTIGVDPGASIERLGPITLTRMAEWLRRPGGVGSGRILVRPVIDTNSEAAVDQHDPPAWMREAMVLRDRTCVFPGCTIGARRCDADHVEPYVPLEEGGARGQTNLRNLAALCRSHHRLKTHTGWGYRRRPDGTYAWWDRWGRPLEPEPDDPPPDVPDPPGPNFARPAPSRVEAYLHDFLVEYAPNDPDPPGPPD